VSSSIDWQSIPMHIRCTGREKIDPRYPGSAQWWAQQDLRAKTGTMSDDRPAHTGNASKSKYMPGLLAATDGRETSVPELAEVWGILPKAVPSIVGSLSFSVPVYEGKEGNQKRFGLLGRTA
jgi:hypothetical protein